MLQQLRIILTAEAAARERLEVARQEAARLVAEAEMEAARMTEGSRDQLDDVARAAEAALVEVAEQQAAQIAVEVTTQIEAMRRTAAARTESAVALILPRLLPPATPPKSTETSR